MPSSLDAPVLVFAEQREGKLKRSVLEVMALARALSGGKVQAVLLGRGVSGLTHELTQHGASRVLVSDDPSLEFASPEAYTAQLAAAVLAVQPAVVLFTASAMGRDLAPRLAARQGSSLVSECLAFQSNPEGFEAKKSMYGGKVFATLQILSGHRVVATIKPGSYPASISPGAGEVESLPLAGPPTLQARVTKIVRAEEEQVDLQEAEIVVSGGRGLKGPENFHLIESLAKALGGAVGASRAVVDAGWIAHHHQVGQTGVTVSPKLYVACGISGAIQHLAGMRTAGCIVAINKDPEAPIFKVADYGIVGDVFEVVPALTEEIRRVKEAS